MPRGVSALDEARLQGRLWTPMMRRADISAWFDFSALPTLTIGTGISRANTVDGTGLYLEQGNTSFQPPFSHSGLNNRAAMTFTANGQYVTMFASSNATLNSTWICSFVTRVDSTSGSNARICGFVSGSGSDWNATAGICVALRSGSNSWQTWQNSSARATSTVSDGANNIFSAEVDGTTLRHFVNGTAGGTGTLSSPNLTTGRWLFGASNISGSDSNLRAGMGEMIAIRGTPTTALRHRMEGYLAHKWGLAERLAGTHPFRNGPPLI